MATSELKQVMHRQGGELGQKDFEVHVSQVGQAVAVRSSHRCVADACLPACLVFPVVLLVAFGFVLVLEFFHDVVCFVCEFSEVVSVCLSPASQYT